MARKLARRRQRKGGNRRGGGEARGADYALNLLAYVGTFEGIASARSVCRGWYRILAADARAQDLRRFVARHGSVTPKARRALWLESCRLSPSGALRLLEHRRFSIRISETETRAPARPAAALLCAHARRH